MSAVRIGSFVRHPRDADFGDTGPARGHLLVFPRTCVGIRHAGQRLVVADPTLVMIYNRGQAYTRHAIAPNGDRCTWFAYPAEAVLAVRGARDEERPFGELVCARSDTRTYALAHAARHATDPLVLDEAALALLERVVAAEPLAMTPHHRALADATRIWLAAHYTESANLEAIAHAVGASTFHLARVFRRATGRSLHAHRTELRIRAAITRIPDEDDLATLALELGFSSHSHFTAAFKHHVGVAPSHARASRNLLARVADHSR
jgi:AraC family transcriptional regulator